MQLSIDSFIFFISSLFLLNIKGSEAEICSTLSEVVY